MPECEGSGTPRVNHPRAANPDHSSPATPPPIGGADVSSSLDGMAIHQLSRFVSGGDWEKKPVSPRKTPRGKTLAIPTVGDNLFDL